jgi:hypothetical protein
MTAIDPEYQPELSELEAILLPILSKGKRRKTTPLNLRIPTALKATLESESAAQGMSLSDYVRIRLSNTVPSRPRIRPRRNTIERQVLVELNRIGVNLNQIARRLNSQEAATLTRFDQQQLSQLLSLLETLQQQIAGIPLSQP